MLEFLPQEIRDGLELGRKRDKMRASRLRVQLGDAVFPILQLWEGGFTLDAARTPQLRGLVDVYDGARHILQGLIVASTVENGQLRCEFKRSNVVRDQPALDFYRDENKPIALLPKH